MQKWWLFPLVILTVTLLLSSCAELSTPELVPASTSTPSAEVTEDLVVLSHSSYVDNFGYFHLVGEVENIGSQNTELNEVTTTFVDNEGNAVVTASCYTYLDILKSGQKSPFEIILSAPPPVANYKLESMGQITSREPYTNLNTEGVTFEREEQGWGSLSGQVRNDGSEIFEIVIVIATFYDASGDVVGVSLTFADMSPLKPNESSSFVILVNPIVVNIMTTYSLKVEGYKES